MSLSLGWGHRPCSGQPREQRCSRKVACSSSPPPSLSPSSEKSRALPRALQFHSKFVFRAVGQEHDPVLHAVKLPLLGEENKRQRAPRAKKEQKVKRIWMPPSHNRGAPDTPAQTDPTQAVSALQPEGFTVSIPFPGSFHTFLLCLFEPFLLRRFIILML